MFLRLGDQIIEFLGNGEKWGLSITISNEKTKMLGTGGGVFRALSYLGNEPFWLINSDIYSNYKINIEKKLIKESLGHLILVSNPSHNILGDFRLDDELVGINLNTNPYTFSGMSVLSKKMFDGCTEEVFALEPLLIEKVKEGKITGELTMELFIDVGSKERLRQVEKILREDD